MSIIFSDNFDNGAVGWDLNPVSTGYGQFGCDFTLCLSCGNNFSLGPRKLFPTLQLNNTWRFNFAYLVSGPSPDVARMLHLFDAGGFHHQLEFIVYPDGHVQIASAESRNSPVGIIPTNGTWVAIQITAHMYTASGGGSFINNVGDFQIVVDNVLKWSTNSLVISANNYSSDPLPTGWQGCELLGYAISGGGGSSALVAYDNFEIEDAVLVKSFSVCPGATNLYANICSNPPDPPPPDDSGLYFMTTSDLKHDKYYNSDKKIPDPTLKTAIIGE